MLKQSTDTRRRRNRKLEADAEKQIIDFLRYVGVSCYSVDNHGKLSPTGKYNNVKYGHRPGVPDIHGFLAPGKMLFIEVKGPEGKLSKPQAEYLAEAAKWGHFAIMARSWMEVREPLLKFCEENAIEPLSSKLKKINPR